MRSPAAGSGELAFGDTEHDELLRESWHGFRERLKEAGDLVVADPAPASPLEGAVGLQYVARNIALRLATSVEDDDPLYPQLWRRNDVDHRFRV